MDPKIELELVAVKTTLDRILNHHDDFKGMFEKIFNKIDSVQSMYHALDKKMGEEDNKIKEHCEKETKGLIKATAGWSIGALTVLIGAVLTYLVYHK